MRVIVDLTLNHTSDQHPWFLASASGPQSPKRDWYVWSPVDPHSQVPWDNDQVWLPRGDDYYFSTFGQSSADLNLRNPQVTAQMYDVARFGVAGHGRRRVPAGCGPPPHRGRDRLHRLAAHPSLAASLGRPPRRPGPATLFSVGEVWADTGTQASYVTGDEVDTVFDFPLADGILSSLQYQAP